MFGFSIWEIFIIMVIALLVIGPERLPGLARTIGTWTYKVKKYVASAKAELDSEFNLQDMKKLLTEQESEISKLRSMMEETRNEVEDSGRYMLGAINEAEQSVQSAAQTAKDSVENSARDTTTKAADKTAEDEAPAGEQTRLLSLDEEIEEIERESGRKLSRPFSAAADESAPSASETTKPTAEDHDERTGRDPERRG